MSLKPVALEPQAHETVRLRRRITDLCDEFGDFDGFYLVLLRRHPPDQDGATRTMRSDRKDAKPADLLHNLICDIVDNRLVDLEMLRP